MMVLRLGFSVTHLISFADSKLMFHEMAIHAM